METQVPRFDPRAGSHSIELKLKDVTQLFNSLDPSPFDSKDLDHDAEEFIESWARELDTKGQLHLRLHIDNPLVAPWSPEAVQDSVRHYFAYRATMSRLELRQLFKTGRITLMIGVSFLALCIFISKLIGYRLTNVHISGVLVESLTIIGWVAMWRPMQIYLYDWWPIKRRTILLERLSRMKVDIKSAS